MWSHVTMIGNTCEKMVRQCVCHHTCSRLRIVTEFVCQSVSPSAMASCYRRRPQHLQWPLIAAQLDRSHQPALATGCPGQLRQVPADHSSLQPSIDSPTIPHQDTQLKYSSTFSSHDCNMKPQHIEHSCTFR